MTRFTIRNGRDISQEVERKPRVEHGTYDASGLDREQPVAIGLRTDDRLGGDVASGAGPVLHDERLPEPPRQPLRHDRGQSVRSGRPASAGDGLFGKEDARVGAVITTGFTLPDTICGPRRRSFSDTHFKQSCRRAPVSRGRRMACTLYAPFAYRIGSSIPIPGIDPAAVERVMALEDRSVLFNLVAAIAVRSRLQSG
jgi:hypothetical protein